MVPVHQNAGQAGQGPNAVRRPRVPAGSRVYAVGDIHGRSDLLWQLHRLIIADGETARGMRKVVVYVGDYVDRGPDSQGVIDMLIKQPLEGFECHHLKGNHEDFMVQFMKTGARGELWMMNGGRVTLESYGVDFYELADGTRMAAADILEGARRELVDRAPESHKTFLAGLSLHRLEGDYLFVHAGVRPGVPLDAQRAHDLMWIREEFLESDIDHGHIVVHGHTIGGHPVVRANRIGIDTGAFRSGQLTALVLEDDTRRFLTT
jgi:serine/threonine protein phosphatase 1